MSQRSRFLVSLGALCLGLAGVTAQQSAPARKPAVGTVADDRGLLLGIYFPNRATLENLTSLKEGDQKWVPDISTKPHGKYLTVWISRSGNAVKIQTVEGLLVPRANGFWKVGANIIKSDQDPDHNFDEHFWAVPAGQKPKPPEADPQVNGASVRL